MELNVNYNHRGESVSATINAALLTKFVDAGKMYPVKYTIALDGTKTNEPALLKGSDLTENQIVEVFISGNL